MDEEKEFQRIDLHIEEVWSRVEVGEKVRVVGSNNPAIVVAIIPIEPDGTIKGSRFPTKKSLEDYWMEVNNRVIGDFQSIYRVEFQGSPKQYDYPASVVSHWIPPTEEAKYEATLSGRFGPGMEGDR